MYWKVKEIDKETVNVAATKIYCTFIGDSAQIPQLVSINVMLILYWFKKLVQLFIHLYGMVNTIRNLGKKQLGERY